MVANILDVPFCIREVNFSKSRFPWAEEHPLYDQSTEKIMDRWCDVLTERPATMNEILSALKKVTGGNKFLLTSENASCVSNEADLSRLLWTTEVQHIVQYLRSISDNSKVIVDYHSEFYASRAAALHGRKNSSRGTTGLGKGPAYNDGVIFAIPTLAPLNKLEPATWNALLRNDGKLYLKTTDEASQREPNQRPLGTRIPLIGIEYKPLGTNMDAGAEFKRPRENSTANEHPGFVWNADFGRYLPENEDYPEWYFARQPDGSVDMAKKTRTLIAQARSYACFHNIAWMIIDCGRRPVLLHFLNYQHVASGRIDDQDLPQRIEYMFLKGTHKSTMSAPWTVKEAITVLCFEQLLRLKAVQGIRGAEQLWPERPVPNQAEWTRNTEDRRLWARPRRSY